ncbi:MAG: hypothetical protein HY600_00835 [Candidatus Omnitrophica bacterium]|nr:hypothetical protein [Candidatus Omnitrophota bacterium]
MRHPMLRGFALLLTGSLAIAPTSAFALRAGLEGDTEEKVAQALVPTSVAAGLEETFQVEPIPVLTLKAHELLVPAGSALLAVHPAGQYDHTLQIYERPPRALTFNEGEQATMAAGLPRAAVYIPRREMLLVAYVDQLIWYPIVAKSTSRLGGVVRHTVERSVLFDGPTMSGITALAYDAATDRVFVAHEDRADKGSVGRWLVRSLDLARGQEIDRVSFEFPIKTLAYAGGMLAVVLPNRRGDALYWVDPATDTRTPRDVRDTTIYALVPGPDDMLLIDEQVNPLGIPPYERLVFVNPATGAERRWRLPDGLQPTGSIAYDAHHRQLLMAVPAENGMYHLRAYPLTGLEEQQPKNAPASAPTLDFEHGTPITADEQMRALRPNDFVAFRFAQHPGSPIFYYRIVRRYDPVLPSARSLELLEVNDVGASLAKPTKWWLIETLLNRQPWQAEKPGGKEFEFRRVTLVAAPADAPVVAVAPPTPIPPPGITAGLEEARALALDSEDGRALVAQLGPAPAGATRIAWVPEAQVTQLMVNPQDFGRVGRNIYVEPSLARDFPPAVNSSRRFSCYHFLPRRLPRATDAMLMALVNTPLSRDISQATTIRFETVEAVRGVTEEALVVVAKHPAFWGLEIRWVAGSSKPVKFQGRDGFAFYL